MLNQYLTNIYILKNNVCNLYFNIKGEDSAYLRVILENDINSLNKFYLNLANLIKKIGGYPIMSLDEIKTISTIKEISSKDYTAKEANSILLKDFNVINSMNNQVGEYALKNFNFGSINLVLEFNNYLSCRVGQFNQ